MSSPDPYQPLNWRRLMRDVDAAPSVLNTKPWLFECPAADRIELRPDWDRHLRVIDPRHRELLISCGAALFNLRMAIRVTGHDPVVWLLPDEQTEGGPECKHCRDHCGVGDLLASVEIVLARPRSPTITEQRMYDAILLRHTVRAPLRHHVEIGLLAEFERVARLEGARARLLHPPEARRLLREAARADRRLRGDQMYQHELDTWTGKRAPTHHGTHLGVPVDNFGPSPKTHHRPLPRRPAPVRNFSLPPPYQSLDRATLDQREARWFERKPQLIVLETRTDTPTDWIRGGQALQRLLLTATHFHVKTSFLTQQREFEDREAEDRDAPSCQSTDQWWPWPRPAQMIIRVGALK